MFEVVGRTFDHAASIVIVIQSLTPVSMVIVVFFKRHLIIHHGKKLLNKDDK